MGYEPAGSTVDATYLQGRFVSYNPPNDGDELVWNEIDKQWLPTSEAGGSGGTVTSVSVTTANGVSGTVATATTTPAITLSLGGITPSSVNGNTITTGTGTLTLAASKTLSASDNVTLASDGTGTRTLNISAGGTLGSAAFTASGAYDTAGAAAAVTPTTLGLVIGTNVQAYDADLTTWAGITPGTNVGTFLATPSSANLRAALTDENGTGAALFDGATSPTFVTPALGTPSALVLTNATGIANISISGTANTGTFGGTTSLLLGTAGSAVGNIGFRNATSGTVTLAPPTGALGTYTVTLPNAASTIPIASQQITWAGPTAARTYTLPDAAATLARTDAANTFTGVQTMTSPVITTPWITTGINDANGNSMLAFTPTASAVDGFTFTNAATAGHAVTMSATGTDSNIDLILNPKGSGLVKTNISFASNYTGYEVTNTSASTGSAYFQANGNNGALKTFFSSAADASGGAAGTLGTQTNHPLSFFTNNSPRLNISGSNITIPGTEIIGWASGTLNPNTSNPDLTLSRNAIGILQIGTTTGNALGSWLATNGTLSGTLAVTGASTLTGAVTQGAKTTTYNNIATEGNGMGAIVKATRVTAQTSNVTVATYTTPASDGSYLVSGNINITAAIAISTSLNCDYTDETNTARTMIIPISGLGGSFLAGGLATSTGPFESTVMHIRTKASTAITIYTAAGTFTSATYNAEGVIRQLQ